MLDLKERIAHELRNLDFMNDPEATDKQEELTAMSISCDAAIILPNAMLNWPKRWLDEKPIRNAKRN